MGYTAWSVGPVSLPLQTDETGELGQAPPAKPIYADTAQLVPVLYGVAGLLFAFTLLVVYADIVKPIQLFSG